jgi:hypothetical protein
MNFEREVGVGRSKGQMQEFLDEVRRAAGKRIIYTEHALNKMNAEEEVISSGEVRQVVFEGEIIEDYPEDVRGHSCLMLAFTEKGRSVHIVCAPKKDYLGIITAYVPTEEKWEADFRTRKREEEG